MNAALDQFLTHIASLSECRVTPDYVSWGIKGGHLYAKLTEEERRQADAFVDAKSRGDKLN